MQISRIDHIVFTVADMDKTIAFYTQILGFQEETFLGNRKALKFGNQKINLHQKGKEFEPKAERPTCGAMDLCLISETPLDEGGRGAGGKAGSDCGRHRRTHRRGRENPFGVHPRPRQ